MVLSIIAYWLWPSAARCVKTRSHTPAVAQRLNRRCILAVAKALRQVTPWYSRMVPVQHRLDKATIVPGGGADVAQLPGSRSLIRSHWSSRSP